MYFTSLGFLLFVTIVFILFYTICRKYQWQLLLVASYIFYALADIKFLPYILFTTISTYFIAIKLENIEDKSKAKIDLEDDKFIKKEIKANTKSTKLKFTALGLVLNFGLLGIVKYTNFIISNINQLVVNLGNSEPIGFMHIILPMGISFYIFKSMSYLIDVNRGKYKAQRNPFKFALYLSFFPQIIQGPISRFDYISKSLFETKKFEEEKIYHAIERILWGLFKKLVIADRLLVAVKVLISDTEQYQGMYVFVLMLMYTYQLYADFTGGIDITIGIGELFGVSMEENFKRPYAARNITDFWRRWHITMGTWFKDYLFFPISVSKPFRDLNKFSRKVFGDNIGKKVPVYLVTTITWFATGLWHGASWNFIVWGLLNGFVIILSQEMKPIFDKFHEKFDVKERKSFIIFQIIRTFFIVSAIRLLDVYRNVGITFAMFFGMFKFSNLNIFSDGSLLEIGLSIFDYIVLGVGFIIIVTISNIQEYKGVSVRKSLESCNWKLRHTIYSILFISIVMLGAYGSGYDVSQFIYNQF